jgi:hypothetical protein
MCLPLHLKHPLRLHLVPLQKLHRQWRHRRRLLLLRQACLEMDSYSAGLNDTYVLIQLAASKCRNVSSNPSSQ